MAKEFVEKYAKYETLWCHNIDLAGDPNHAEELFPVFEAAVYKYSRLAYQGAED